MSNDNVLDQSEIERLLGGMGAASSSPAAPAPAPESSGGILDQSELDALFGGSSPPAEQTPPSAPTLGGMLDQSQIESLLGGVKPTTSTGTVSADSSAPTSQKNTGVGMIGGPITRMEEIEDDEDGVPHGDIDYIHKRADESLRSIVDTKLSLPTEVIEFQYPEFGGTIPSSEHATLDQISEVELNVKIELGRTEMYIEDVLKLRKGSVVPLDKMAGDAVDIFINGRLLARGEVLVMNENFCVRVAELHAGAIPME